MKQRTMNYLTVLDFTTGKVYMYDVGADGWNPDDENVQGYLVAKGHNLQSCEWMVHEDNTIITN